MIIEHSIQPLRVAGIGMDRMAASLIEIIAAMRGYEFVGLTSVGGDCPPRSRWPAGLIGDADSLENLKARGIRAFFIVNAQSLTPTQSASLFQKAVEFGFQPVTLVHSRACIARSAVIGPGCAILAGAVVGPNSIVRKNAFLGSGAIVEHDCQISSNCRIGAGALISHGVILDEGVVVPEGAHIQRARSAADEAAQAEGCSTDADKATVIKKSPPGGRLQMVRRFLLLDFDLGNCKDQQ